MNILITGGAGFIGSNLVAALLKEGYTVTIVDNFNDYYNPQIKRKNIQPLIVNKNFTCVEGDITDKELLRRVFKNNAFDKVIHLAASVGVRNSLKYPELYRKNNVDGTQNVLDMVGAYGVRHFLFASSSSVYGNNSLTPFQEDRVIDSPLNPYAQTKKTAESLCLTHHKIFHTPVTVFRFFTVYGPNGRPDMSPYIFTKSVLEGKPIRIFGDGRAQRDFTFIDDIVNGILRGLEKPFSYEIFNLGSSVPIAMFDFVKKIGDICKKTPSIQFYPRNDFEMIHTYADISKAKSTLNYSPKTTIEDGLSLFIQWFQAYKI